MELFDVNCATAACVGAATRLNHRSSLEGYGCSAARTAFGSTHLARHHPFLRTRPQHVALAARTSSPTSIRRCPSLPTLYMDARVRRERLLAAQTTTSPAIAPFLHTKEVTHNEGRPTRDSKSHRPTRLEGATPTNFVTFDELDPPCDIYTPTVAWWPHPPSGTTMARLCLHFFGVCAQDVHKPSRK